jgi:hypothetical protein
MTTVILPDVWIDRRLHGRRGSDAKRKRRAPAFVGHIVHGAGEACKDRDETAHL